MFFMQMSKKLINLHMVPANVQVIYEKSRLIAVRAENLSVSFGLAYAPTHKHLISMLIGFAHPDKAYIVYF